MLSSQIFHIFAGKDVSGLTIVGQCQYPETVYATDFTGENPDITSFLETESFSLQTRSSELNTPTSTSLS